jgi:hypothetical protein
LTPFLITVIASELRQAISQVSSYVAHVREGSLSQLFFDLNCYCERSLRINLPFILLPGPRSESSFWPDQQAADALTADRIDGIHSASTVTGLDIPPLLLGCWLLLTSYTSISGASSMRSSKYYDYYSTKIANYNRDA